ncbi:hypothetical protein DKX15_22430 [Enterococcus faecium]|nr:hypothetical protein DKX15_22430 [Enterococcus faecium]
MIAEYKEHIFENSMIKKTVEYAKASTFHPFIDGNDTNHSFNSFDAALAGAIAYRAEGPNHHADGYFMKMIEI